MIKTELVALCQQKETERKAAEYVAKVERKRKQMKRKRAIIGTVVVAFFIASCGFVGESDLETERAIANKAMAMETESETEIIAELETTHSLNGVILYKNLIETKNGMRWIYDAYLPEETEVTVYFNDNGTTNPLDDVVLEVTER